MSANGKEYWQSVEQLAASEEFLEKISQEFPGYNPQELLTVSRRRFMKFMGASMALAGITLTGCRRWPRENLAPYASNPGGMPGVAEQYATVWEFGGVGNGLLVTSYDGRPIKIEGNPSHPFARKNGSATGSSDPIVQAAVLELYDPDRSRTAVDRTGAQPRAASWLDFIKGAEEAFGPMRGSGEGVAVLSEASSSPSVADMRARFTKSFPKAVWYEYEPISRDNEIAGTKLAFGKAVRPYLHLEKAQTIVLLDADLFGEHPAKLRYANDWVTGRKSADNDRPTMNRMFIAESTFSITGTVADERLAVKPSRIAYLASALAAQLGVNGATQVSLEPAEAKWVEAAAADLKRGRGVVAAGWHASPEVHAAVAAINSAIGAIGNTVTLHEEPDGNRPAHREAIANLAKAIKAGQVKSLLIIGGNPVYDAPADLDFARLLTTIPSSIHLSVYNNETSILCKWHVPKAHFLESWGDARAWDGTVSLQQPLILPLFGGRSTIEVLALLTGDEIAEGEAIVRRTFAANFKSDWRRGLHDGLVENTTYPAANGEAKFVKIPLTESKGMELRFMPDQHIYDGRFANSGWLQEAPRSLTKLTWDNAAMINQQDSDKLGAKHGDVVAITVEGRVLNIALYVLPGQPLGVIGLPLGYGRTAAGHVGNELGFNTYFLRTTTGMDTAIATSIAKTGDTYNLVMTQDHHILDPVGTWARDVRVGEKNKSGMIIREATFAEYSKNRMAPNEGHRTTIPLQLFDPPMEPVNGGKHPYNDSAAWGMAIDMSSCIGCNACTVACQAENNIPVVGKHEVDVNREMHWLRIDRYFKGATSDVNPEVVFQPMMCVHCENAPCEQVCPVAATMHDTEGVNVMIYNRCIGTRYCSNNCPYKVRRFNYLDWQSKDPRGWRKPWLGIPDTQQKEEIDNIKKMLFNPEVSVRMRGVMEKCTYCLQRIHNTQIVKRNAGEPLKDGDIVTACQQACPTEAITFGDLNDPNSKVSQLQRSTRSYSVLDELNTKPRSMHMAKIRNPVNANESQEMKA